MSHWPYIWITRSHYITILNLGNQVSPSLDSDPPQGSGHVQIREGTSVITTTATCGAHVQRE
jgi:hypothetical protein